MNTLLDSATEVTQAAMVGPGAILYTTIAYRLLSRNRQIRNLLIAATLTAALLFAASAPALPTLTVGALSTITWIALATGNVPRRLRRPLRNLGIM